MISKLILFLSILMGVNSLTCMESYPSECEYNSTCQFKEKECNPTIKSNVRGGVYCSTIIKKIDKILISTMDCMYDQEVKKSCKNQTTCQLTFIKKDENYLHCCCDKHLCNFNFTILNEDIQKDSSETENCVDGNQCKQSKVKLISIIIPIILLILFLILIIFCIINRKQLLRSLNKLRDFCGKSPQNSNGKLISTKEENEILINNDHNYFIDFNQLEIGETIKHGKYSLIKKGIYKDNSVALKILIQQSENNQMKNLFENEKNIYLSSNIIHKNILKFYGYSINKMEKILITELSLNGTLRDVLRSQLISNENHLLFILKEISEGLEYLHNDSRKDQNGRPPIAHRDLKSDNILFINSQKIVICDFAMSIQLDQNQNNPNEQQQIGTARYMSPELLSGAIGYETNSLLKCDVYALGIIFWEVLSRCSNQDPNDPYEIPFEKELMKNGLNPNPRIEEMNRIVHSESPFNRPLIKSSWKNNSNKIINETVHTIEQCWDQNPEGRITSALVAHRMRQIQSLI